MAGPVEDDRRHAAEDDREAHTRQDDVAQVPEQERCEQPGEVQAGRVGDQPPVDERDGRGEKPERRGSGEGVAPPREEPEHDHHGCRDAEPQGRLAGHPGCRA